jgi:hypothetical protein
METPWNARNSVILSQHLASSRGLGAGCENLPFLIFPFGPPTRAKGPIRVLNLPKFQLFIELFLYGIS